MLNRSPPKLLAEVILVDDASAAEYLHDPLRDYLVHLPKVRLIRHDVREGLIRSRMQGARAATGDVIVFLDAHTEANINWLVEILSHIKRDPHIVVQPLVDGISAQTIEYGSTGGNHIGIMSWDLNYRWIKLGKHETKRLKSPIDPIYTPSLVGCAIAVQRDYFFHIGAFDEGMDIWGGENIELSLRTWLCGGKTLTLPCSRVAHVFKEFTYGFGKLGKDTILQKNLIRIAETFMDEHKKYFYASTRTHKEKRDVKLSDVEWASLERRKKLRKDLFCKPFEWFVNTIIPNLPLPPMDVVFYGEITSQASSLCWVPRQANDGVYIAMTNQCYFHKIIPENYFKITQNGRLMFGELCVEVKMPSPFLVLTKCKLESDIYEQGLWSLMQGGSVEIGKVQVQTYMDKQLYTFCIEQVTNILEPYKGEQVPQVGRCKQDNRFQEWRFTYKIDFETHTNNTRAN
ncbi:unnamed protein product [Owenia fusiformis]|uniref:Polypeptide N-acetylgalactosaminyltransferase n=1 Tax=Owenia fusiformis TaxID=6347 RepID=A0A8J1TXB4_OWEFU|nr:unnamed protein product [Owenia fusiformis]